MTRSLRTWIGLLLVGSIAALWTVVRPRGSEGESTVGSTAPSAEPSMDESVRALSEAEKTAGDREAFQVPTGASVLSYWLRVTDQDGDPLAGAKVTSPSGWASTGDFTTDEGGR